MIIDLSCRVDALQTSKEIASLLKGMSIDKAKRGGKSLIF